MGYRFKPGASPTVDAYRARYGSRLVVGVAEDVCRTHGTTLTQLQEDEETDLLADGTVLLDDLFFALGY